MSQLSICYLGFFLFAVDSAGRKLKAGQSRVLYGLGEDYTAIAVANLGKQDVGFCHLDQLEEGRENVRSAIASELVKIIS